MRILFVSNYLSYSGYATQARMIVPAIKALGHDVEVLPIGAMHADLFTHAPDGMKLLPLAQDPLGNDIVLHHYTRGGFDAVLTFTDVWGLDPGVYQKMCWYPITPIDTYTLAPRQEQALRACKFPIAISRFGQQVIKDGIGMESHYLPMMVDTDFWRPGDKSAARRALGIQEEGTTFMFVGVNRDLPSRKGIPELLMAWSRCLDVLPPDTHLHMHTAQRGAVNVEAMANQLGIPKSRLRLADEAQYHTGLHQNDMLLFAQAADVLIQPSRREGACLPLLEYQSCGIPVIASQAHAQQEYNKGQFRVRGERSWFDLGAWGFTPSVTSIQEQILEASRLLQTGEQWEHLKLASRTAMIEDHSIANVTDQHLSQVLQAVTLDVLKQE